MKTIRYQSPEQLRAAGLKVGDEVIIPFTWQPEENPWLLPPAARGCAPAVVRPGVFRVAAVGFYGAGLALVGADLSRPAGGPQQVRFALPGDAPGWADSNLAGLLNGKDCTGPWADRRQSLTGQLPARLWDAIIPRTIRQNMGGRVEECECRFWALSVTEVFGEENGPLYRDGWLYIKPSAADEGDEQFPLFKAPGRRRCTPSGEDGSWWLRTLLDDEGTLGTVVTPKGTLAPRPAGEKAGCLFGFLL